MSKMTVPRKAIATLTAIAAGALTLTACSTATGDSGSGETTLTVGTNGGDAMKSVIAAFEDANPGVKVVVKDSPENYQQVTATQLTGGTAPDVVQIWPGVGNNMSVDVLGGKDQLADLTGASWAGALPDSALTLLSKDDKLLAVPMTFSSIGGIYNQKELDALGLKPPTTWSQVLDFCSAATAAGKVAYGLGLSDTWTTQLIPYALTASLVYGPDPDFVQKQLDGSTTFSDSAWRDAFQQYLDMDEAGCFNESPSGTPYSTVQQAIVDGTTLATVSVAAETKGIASLGSADTELTFAAFPATDNAAETVLSATTGPSFAINAATKHEDLARKFIDWLADPKTQVAYANTYGDTAAMPGDQDQGTQVASMVGSFVADGNTASWPDQQWPTTTVQPAMFDGVQALFTGQDDISGVLSKMDAAFNE